MRHVLAIAAIALVGAMAACSAKPMAVASPSALTPAEINLDFGVVPPGTTASKSVEYTLQGSGSTQLTVDPSTLPAGFTVTGDGALAAGSSRTIQIVFASTSPRFVAGRIVIRAPGTVQGQAVIDVWGRGSSDAIATVPSDCLDYGSVRVGTIKTLPMEVYNLIDSPQHVAIVSDDPAFTIEPDTVDLVGSGAGTIQVTFRPPSRGNYAGPHLHFVECASCEVMRRSVCASGVVDSMKLDSTFLDFGKRSVGFTSCQDVTVTNDGDLPWSLASIAGDASFESSGFTLDTGHLLDGMTELAPRSTGTVRVCFTPTVHGQDASGNVIFGTSEGPRAELQVRGKGDPAGLVVTPAAIDFGTTTFTSPVTKHLVIENGGGPTTLKLESVALDAPDEAIGLAFPDGDPAGFDMSQGDFHVDLVFGPTTPGIDVRSLVVQVVHPGGSLESKAIPLTGTAVDGHVCGLSVAPPEIRFGLVHAGEAHDLPVRITNTSQIYACKVWDLGLDPQGSPSFQLLGGPAPAEIAPGTWVELTVRYDPPVPQIVQETTALVFGRVTDVGVPTSFVLPVSGFPSALDVSADPLDFGVVKVGELKWMAVNLVDHSNHLVKVGSYGAPATASGDIVLSRGAAPGFLLDDLPAPMPATLAAGGQLTFSAGFAPVDAGAARAEVEVWLSHALAPILVPLTATGTSEICGEACTRPSAVCPGKLDGFVHGAVTLEGAAHRPFLAAECSWRVVGAPSGSAAALEATSPCRPTFRPDVAGDYSFELTAGGGSGATCTTSLHAEVYPGLWVETTWSDPDDLDLHFFHPSAGDVLSARTWFSLPYDCTFGNQTPYWDTAGADDDPVLVRDDEYGTGPEEVRVAVPSIDHAYEIGAHWFSSRNGNVAETVTTRVYCAGQQVAEVQDVLSRLYQAVDVGSVQWNGDGTCSFEASGFTLSVIP